MELIKLFQASRYFYPRPPGGGRHRPELAAAAVACISIHALRVEGDAVKAGGTGLRSRNFYPRPPGGGRRARAGQRRGKTYFYPRPPGGGRHAERIVDTLVKENFYPRPPGGGRQKREAAAKPTPTISIHALRVEGDRHVFGFFFCCGGISIHALRVEGDICLR